VPTLRRYIEAQEILKTNAIAKILSKQKEKLAVLLEWPEFKSQDDQIGRFIEEIAPEIPDYLLLTLPAIMTTTSKNNIRKYRKYLPEWYVLSFNLPSDPAVVYLTQLKELMLSQNQGSISKTTNDEVRAIIANWLQEWQSYSQIAKEIRETDPFVFSKSRAKLIAVNEIGRAYGFADYQPLLEVQSQWFIMEKKWVTSNDLKVRPSHYTNQSDWWIPLNNYFTGTGDTSAPSNVDYRCRCTMTSRIVW